MTSRQGRGHKQPVINRKQAYPDFCPRICPRKPDPTPCFLKPVAPKNFAKFKT
jgi:hypothetical protein